MPISPSNKVRRCEIEHPELVEGFPFPIYVLRPHSATKKMTHLRLGFGEVLAAAAARNTHARAAAEAKPPANARGAGRPSRTFTHKKQFTSKSAARRRPKPECNKRLTLFALPAGFFNRLANNFLCLFGNLFRSLLSALCHDKSDIISKKK